jgi:D-alanyl-lipoteichoic acid acyltransferase DltB (MBOAT superfamily)
MIFTSFEFILFFGILFFLYFAIPQKFKWILLLMASYFFYAYTKIEYLLLLIFPTIGIYLLTIGLERVKSNFQKRNLLISGLILGLAGLILFKYLDFLGEFLYAAISIFTQNSKYKPIDFILPIGISFYSFKLISYLLDVYYDRLKAERHLGFFALYVSFFPQLLAGPIDRAVNFIPELKKKVDFDYDRITSGLRLILWGVFKKLVIADQLAVLVNQVYDNAHNYTGFPLLLATVSYSFQIYCDFSGYSDIAIGLSRILGFKSMKNFNSPYASQSITKFWNNWHISLSTWLRDYLFLPIAYATMRKIKKPHLGQLKPETWGYIIGMFLTMFLGGLWHGAKWTFVLWGTAHGLFVILSYTFKRFRKKMAKKLKITQHPRLLKVIRVSITFSLVTFAWIFFRANSTSDAFYILSHLHIGLGDFLYKLLISVSFHLHLRPLKDLIEQMGFSVFSLMTVVVSIFIMEIVQLHHRKKQSIDFWFRKKPLLIRWFCYFILLSIIIYWGKYDIKEFIYFQF